MNGHEFEYFAINVCVFISFCLAMWNVWSHFAFSFSANLLFELKWLFKKWKSKVTQEVVHSLKRMRCIQISVAATYYSDKSLHIFIVCDRWKCHLIQRSLFTFIQKFEGKKTKIIIEFGMRHKINIPVNSCLIQSKSICKHIHNISLITLNNGWL